MLYAIVVIFHVVACLVLISVILLQSGRGGGLSEMLGGGVAQQTQRIGYAFGFMEIQSAAGQARCRSRSARYQILDRIFDGQDLFGGIVRNFASELLLESHHQLDRIQAVRPQVIDKARVFGNLVLLDAEMFDDDFLNAFGNVADDRVLDYLIIQHVSAGALSHPPTW